MNILQICPSNSIVDLMLPDEGTKKAQQNSTINVKPTESSWISILPQEILENLVNQKKEKEVHGLINMLVAATLESIKMYQNSEYAQLDAHIGNNGCEVQAFNILSLAHSNDLKEECEEMLKACEKISKWIKNRQSTNQKERNAKFGPLNQLYVKVQGMSTISPKMMYLIQSHLLCLIKKYKHDINKFNAHEYETFEKAPQNLRKINKSIQLGNVDKELQTIVSVVQSKLSLSSILFMRAELDKLPYANEKEGLLIKKMLSDENLLEYPKKQENSAYLPKTYSCNYYNAKALLLLLAELKSPFIIRKMTKKEELTSQCFAFKPCEKFGQFEEMSAAELEKIPAKTPVIICLAYLPDMDNEEWLKKVTQYGLGNMILANLSQGGQFLPKEPELFPISDKEALNEIKQAEIKAKEVECVWAKESILDIDHFYCSTWEKKALNIGACGS